MRRIVIGLLLVASVSLTGCVTSKWLEVEALGTTPLSTEEIQERFAGNTLTTTSADGRAEHVYVTNSMQFIPVEGGRNRIFAFDMLKNGILCATTDEQRFCYRVYEKNGQFMVVYANGGVFQKGAITPGNQFGV